MSGPGQYRYIHFVAHGTASRSSPLDSAVILSPAPKNPEDFKLYARDIVHQPLQPMYVERGCEVQQRSDGSPAVCSSRDAGSW